MSAQNQHGDMVAISAHLKLEADLKDEIYNLEHENAVLRVELEQQAICNGAGASRELALRSTIAELQRENAALNEQKASFIQSACGKERKEYNTALMAFAPEWLGRHYLTAATAMVHRAQKAEADVAALRESMKSITPFLAELVKVFDCAQTNGDLFDLADVCIKYRAAIDAARKEQP